VRLSLHPVTTNEEVLFICDALKQVVANIAQWKKPYNYNQQTNEFECAHGDHEIIDTVKDWFEL